MVTWKPFAGATLHMPSGPDKHLFVVLNDPKVFEGYGTMLCIALVNLSTVPNNPNVKFDSTCIVQPGCHPFVKQPSYVYYKHAELKQLRDVLSHIEKRLYIPHDTPMAASELARIRYGLKASPFTARALKRLDI
jgi:hypothetical protein